MAHSSNWKAYPVRNWLYRIDKETAVLLLLAKTDFTFLLLILFFLPNHHNIEYKYFSLVADDTAVSLSMRYSQFLTG
ncbi:MAG: hypothetical protein ACKO5Q_04010 [Microcystaceae cyanobacterium]